MFKLDHPQGSPEKAYVIDYGMAEATRQDESPASVVEQMLLTLALRSLVDYLVDRQLPFRDQDDHFDALQHVFPGMEMMEREWLERLEVGLATRMRQIRMRSQSNNQ